MNFDGNDLIISAEVSVIENSGFTTNLNTPN